MIREFPKRRTGNATTAEVSKLAVEIGVSRATAYRLIRLFLADGAVLSLVDRKRRRPQGHQILDEKREEIVRTTINAYYPKRTRPPALQLIRDIQTNCMTVGRKPSRRRTIVARLLDTDLEKRTNLIT